MPNSLTHSPPRTQPPDLGRKDVFLAAGQIACIQDSIDPGSGLEVEVIDARDMFLIPGLIDAHVHITGGGGEGGFKTRTPEIQLSTLVRSGITTVKSAHGLEYMGSVLGISSQYPTLIQR